MDPLGFVAVMIMCLTLLLIVWANRQHNRSIDFTREQCDHAQTKKCLAKIVTRLTEVEIDHYTLTERFTALTCQLKHEDDEAVVFTKELTDRLDHLEGHGCGQDCIGPSV